MGHEPTDLGNAVGYGVPLLLSWHVMWQLLVRDIVPYSVPSMSWQQEWWLLTQADRHMAILAKFECSGRLCWLVYSGKAEGQSSAKAVDRQKTRQEKLGLNPL